MSRTSVYVVRESPERSQNTPEQFFWLGAAEDPQDAARKAVAFGPFPTHYGDMRVWDDTSGVTVVTQAERNHKATV